MLIAQKVLTAAWVPLNNFLAVLKTVFLDNVMFLLIIFHFIMHLIKYD
jgi:hypothetical protein